MTRRYRFVWVDVFASAPLEGNPLAVFPDARGLSDTEMQSVARETCLSETTFVFPGEEATDRARGFRTRIFAVMGEMPFAGHPTLGTASVLRAERGGDAIALLENVGRIPVTFTPRDGRVFGEMVQVDPTVGAVHDTEEVARALGVDRTELSDEAPVQTISTGNPFAIVPFRRRAVLERLRPDVGRMDDYLGRSDAKFFYLVTRETRDPSAALHARMLFAGGEDPATGSAAGPAAAWMVLHGLARPDAPLLVEQGWEVHRPSRIHARAGLEDGRPVQVRVGGFSVPVIHGELTLGD